MTIKDQKDLAKLIALCRKTGVQSIRVDNIEFHLGERPQILSSSPRAALPKASPTSSGPDIIESDEMTEDQLLMWSVNETGDTNVSDTN